MTAARSSDADDPILHDDYSLAPIGITAVLFVIFGEGWLADLSNPWWLSLMFVWLFSAILWGAIRVVHHADSLAIKLGEPYGTLLLTLSVFSIEVLMIAVLMLTGANNPTLARDTMFSVVMIVLNGMVGISLLVGAIRYHEQSYNLQGANAYLGLIVPLAVLSMVLPDFTTSTSEPTLTGFQSLFLILICLALYAIFLVIQMTRHSGYFAMEGEGDTDEDDTHHGLVLRSIPYHFLLLACYLLAVVLMAKKLAIPVNYAIEGLGAPAAFGGFIVAALVLAPEALGAIQAALHNRLQRSVNIALGSVLATIGLTVPAVLTIGLVTGKTVQLGLQGTGTIVLLLTLVTAIVTFSSNRTNVLQGSVHLVLFLAYLMLIFAP
jgi:Ca2+:H+ antiporter